MYKYSTSTFDSFFSSVVWLEAESEPIKKIILKNAQYINNFLQIP